MDVAIPAIYAYVLQACHEGIIIDLLSPTPRLTSTVLSPRHSDRRRSTPLPGSALGSGGPTFVSVSPDTAVLPSLCARTSKLPIDDAVAQAMLLGTELWLSVDVNVALKEARRVLALEGLLAVLVANTISSTPSRHKASLKNESTWWEPDADEVGAILKQHFPYVSTLTINEVVGCTLHDERSNEKTELMVSFPRDLDTTSEATHLLFIATRRPRKLPSGLNLVVRSVAGRWSGDVRGCLDMLCAQEGSPGLRARISSVDDGALDRLNKEIEVLKSSRQEVEQTLRESRASLEGQTRQLGAVESARASLESELSITTRELEQAFMTIDKLSRELEHEADNRESAEQGGRELEASLTIAERRAIQTEVRCRRLNQHNLELQNALERSTEREKQSEIELRRVVPFAERDRGRATRAEADLERFQQSINRERTRREGLEAELLRAEEALSQAHYQSEGAQTSLSRLELALEAEAEKRREAEVKIAELLEALAVTRGTAERASDGINRTTRVNDDLLEEVTALRLELDQARDQATAAARGLQELLGADQYIHTRGGSPALQDIVTALTNNQYLRSSMLRLMAVARDEFSGKGQA